MSCHRGLQRAALAALLTIVAPAGALACRCVEPSRNQAYRQAAAVVFGTIESVRQESAYNAFYTVSVEEAWKARLGDRLTIRSGSTCIYRAQAGQTHLLFLWPYTPGTYQTSRCLGNQPSAAAGPTLRFLRGTKRASRGD